MRPDSAKTGIPGVDASIWVGLFAPKGTPTEIISRLYQVAVDVLKQPAMKERYASVGGAKTTERIALAVDESFIFAGLRGWTVVTVKKILPDKVLLEYRSDFEHRGMKAQDKGMLELVYRKPAAQ